MSLVCWSGGLDSTLVLYDLAMATTRDKPIRAISLVCSQMPANEEQRQARERILAWFKRKNLPVEHAVVKVENEHPDGFETHGNPQATIWLNALQYLRDGEDLYSGYHRGDDFWQSAPALQESFTAMRKMAGHTGAWLFPLEYVNKWQIIERIKKAGLYNLCWYCSSVALNSHNRPEGYKRAKKPCGDCLSCYTHRVGLTELKLRESQQKHTKRFLSATISDMSKKVALAPVEKVASPGPALMLGPHNTKKTRGKKQAKGLRKEVTEVFKSAGVCQ